MKQIPIGFPTELEKYLRRESAASYLSLAGYIRKLVQEDKSRKEPPTCQHQK